jgi:hypothetical protein
MRFKVLAALRPAIPAPMIAILTFDFRGMCGSCLIRAWFCFSCPYPTKPDQIWSSAEAKKIAKVLCSGGFEYRKVKWCKMVQTGIDID